MSGQKKRFKDLSPAGRAWASVVLAISLVIIFAAERDIQRRAESEVRGRKLIWRLASLNALGAISYFRWGRKRDT